MDLSIKIHPSIRQRIFSSSQLHPRPAHPSSSMVTPVERPDHRRDRHDRAIPSAEPPCPEAASSSTAQTSMSARARRASASPSRPTPSEHATAKCFTCTGLHTGTLRGWTCCARGARRRWVAHGATGTEWEIWRVGNPHGTCTRQMGALDRLDRGLGRRQGPVRRGSPGARSTLRPDLA